jgi:hypothetical protein
VRNTFRFIIRNPEDKGVGGRVMFKRLLSRYGVSMWIGLNWLRIGTSGGVT